MSESTPSPSGSSPIQKIPTSKSISVPQDKRQYPRFKVEGAWASVGKLSILESVLGPKKHPVVNLSQGGAMIRLGKKHPVDSRHELHIEVPKCREVIECTAEIRWCLSSAKKESDIYVGVMFVDLAPAERRKIAGMYELFSSTEYKQLASARKDASSIRLKAPRL